VARPVEIKVFQKMDFESACRSMSSLEKLTLWNVWILGMSLAEIARREKVTRQAVCNRMRRVYKQLEEARCTRQS
jgi:predicted DNA-binding protein YlxM (UPF0122 family)